ncbi:MAG: hypothetical protein L6Q78_14145 [Bacteroidia bacterium]|nr:hypothetical protein [Bacteroidia bacterium]
MTTVAERKKIAEWVLNTKDEVLLDKVKELTLAKAKAIKNFIADYNSEIDEAVERVRSGKFSTYDEVEAVLNKWESK